MPNRIIKDSAFTSEKIAALSDFQFRLWVGLILLADDLGHGDARPEIIKGRLFPFNESMQSAKIKDAVCQLETCGCISLYEVEGRRYYSFDNWGEHQRIRNVKPKYPLPEDAKQDASCGNLRQSAAAATCGNLPQSAANCGNLRPESEYNTNTNPIQNTNPKTTRVRARGGSDNAEIDFADLPLEDLLRGNVRLANSAREWIRYKLDRGDNFGEMSLKKTISEFNFYSQTFSDDQICSLVDHCIGSTYSAITWDKLKQSAPRNVAQEQLDMIDNW